MLYEVITPGEPRPPGEAGGAGRSTHPRVGGEAGGARGLLREHVAVAAAVEQQPVLLAAAGALAHLARLRVLQA